MSDVLVVGATGLIGMAFLDLISNHKAYPEVITVTRRKIESIESARNIRQLIVDFNKLEDFKEKMIANTMVCALGTTIKKAGSQEKFREVDYSLPLKIADIVLENGCRNFILVSAVGADSDSGIFYNRVKGELEDDIQERAFKSIHILRPSLLLGNRNEFRAGEKLAQIFLSPIRGIIPFKYRPIYAREVSGKMLDILAAPNEGVHVYEGLSLH